MFFRHGEGHFSSMAPASRWSVPAMTAGRRPVDRDGGDSRIDAALMANADVHQAVAEYVDVAKLPPRPGDGALPHLVSPRLAIIEVNGRIPDIVEYVVGDDQLVLLLQLPIGGVAPLVPFLLVGFENVVDRGPHQVLEMTVTDGDGR
jgi:hypothetical protein